MKNRYNKKLLKALGQLHSDVDYQHAPAEDLIPSDDMNVIACGKFRHIIETVFDNPDGSLPNTLNLDLSDNSPDSVKEFVRNILSKDVIAAKSATDDDSAFAAILPRSMQCGSGLDEYRQRLTTAIRRYGSEYRSKNSPKSN